MTLRCVCAAQQSPVGGECCCGWCLRMVRMVTANGASAASAFRGLLRFICLAPTLKDWEAVKAVPGTRRHSPYLRRRIIYNKALFVVFAAGSLAAESAASQIDLIEGLHIYNTTYDGLAPAPGFPHYKPAIILSGASTCCITCPCAIPRSPSTIAMYLIRTY